MIGLQQITGDDRQGLSAPSTSMLYTIYTTLSFRSNSAKSCRPVFYLLDFFPTCTRFWLCGRMLIVGAPPNGCQASYFARVEALAGLLRSEIIACHNSASVASPVFMEHHAPPSVPAIRALSAQGLHETPCHRLFGSPLPGSIVAESVVPILSGRWSP